MTVTDTTSLIHRYYANFNSRNWEGFFELLTEDVVHDLNQGARETGKPAFSAFIDRMNASYSEQIVDIAISRNRKPRAGAKCN